MTSAFVSASANGGVAAAVGATAAGPTAVDDVDGGSARGAIVVGTPSPAAAAYENLAVAAAARGAAWPAADPPAAAALGVAAVGFPNVPTAA